MKSLFYRSRAGSDPSTEIGPIGFLRGRTHTYTAEQIEQGIRDELRAILNSDEVEHCPDDWVHADRQRLKRQIIQTIADEQREKNRQGT